jgi:hypothetical protein
MNEYVAGRITDYLQTQDTLSLTENDDETVHVVTQGSKDNPLRFYRETPAVEVSPEFMIDNEGVGVYTNGGLGIRVNANNFSKLKVTLDRISNCIIESLENPSINYMRTATDTVILTIDSDSAFEYDILTTQLAAPSTIRAAENGETWGAKETRHNLKAFYNRLSDLSQEQLQKEVSSGGKIFPNGVDGLGPKRSERLATELDEGIPEFKYLFSNNKGPFEYVTEMYLENLHTLFDGCSVNVRKELICPKESSVIPFGGFTGRSTSSLNDIEVTLESYPEYFTQNEIRINVTEEVDWPFVSDVERGEQLLVEAKGLFLLSLGVADKLPEV